MNALGMAKMLAVTGIFMTALAVPAGASLLEIGTAVYGGNSYKLIYDDDSPMGSVVYLDYTRNYVPFGAGATSWDDQAAWANSLNNAGVLTYNMKPGYTMIENGKWRLPSAVDGRWESGTDGTTTGGFNITSSELGHLYYAELGNKGQYGVNGTLQSGYGLSNTGLFDHLLSGFYWSGTDFSQTPEHVWAFDTAIGKQYAQSIGLTNHFAIAVFAQVGEEGEPVPEPSTILLLVLGLAGLVSIRFLRRP